MSKAVAFPRGLSCLGLASRSLDVPTLLSRAVNAACDEGTCADGVVTDVEMSGWTTQATAD
eukprot:SAG22_NODE_3925_length_1466_cov_1.225311_2_plen_60_part_01